MLADAMGLVEGAALELLDAEVAAEKVVGDTTGALAVCAFWQRSPVKRSVQRHCTSAPD